MLLCSCTSWTLEHGSLKITIKQDYTAIDTIYNKDWPLKSPDTWIYVTIKMKKLQDLSNYNIPSIINRRRYNYIRLFINIHTECHSDDILKDLNCGFQNINNVVVLELSGPVNYNAKWLPKSIRYLRTNGWGVQTLTDIALFSNLKKYIQNGYAKFLGNMYIPGMLESNSKSYKIEQFTTLPDKLAQPLNISQEQESCNTQDSEPCNQQEQELLQNALKQQQTITQCMDHITQNKKHLATLQARLAEFMNSTPDQPDHKEYIKKIKNTNQAIGNVYQQTQESIHSLRMMVYAVILALVYIIMM